MFALTAAQTLAIQNPNVKRRLFIWCDAIDPDTLLPDPAGFWDDVGNITYLGKLYYGSGQVIRVTSIPARGDLTVPGITISLVGVSVEVIDLTRASGLDQAPIEVKIGLFNTSTHELLEPLLPFFDGFVDNVKIPTPEAGGDSVIELVCESTSRQLTAARTTTQTDTNCRKRYSTDAFYAYGAVQMTKPLYFGRAAPTT